MTGKKPGPRLVTEPGDKEEISGMSWAGCCLQEAEQGSQVLQLNHKKW